MFYSAISFREDPTTSPTPTGPTPIPDPNKLLAELDSDGKTGAQIKDRYFGKSGR